MPDFNDELTYRFQRLGWRWRGVLPIAPHRPDTRMIAARCMDTFGANGVRHV